MATPEINGQSYYINDQLKKVWDKIRNGQLANKDEDRVYIVDGRERSGKSVFALQQAYYIDPTLNLTRVCFNSEEFIQAVRNASKGQVVIFDEAFRGLSSRSALSKINKRIIQILKEIGQRNLVIFIVLPSFFMLDIHPAMLRSNALFHVYKDKKGNRGFFRVYNYSKKAKLYQIGLRKGWNYGTPYTRFKGRFFNKYPIDEMEYRVKKDKALREEDQVKPDEDILQTKYREAMYFWMAGVKETSQKNIFEIEEMAQRGPHPVKKTMVAEACQKWRETWRNILSASPNIYNLYDINEK